MLIVFAAIILYTLFVLAIQIHQHRQQQVRLQEIAVRRQQELRRRRRPY